MARGKENMVTKKRVKDGRKGTNEEPEEAHSLSFPLPINYPLSPSATYHKWSAEHVIGWCYSMSHTSCWSVGGVAKGQQQQLDKANTCSCQTYTGD